MTMTCTRRRVGMISLAAMVVAQAPMTPAFARTPRIVQPVLGSRGVPVIVVDGLKFRDLDRDGRLTPYEDWRRSPEARAQDLVSRMTLAEKAGATMHENLPGLGGERGVSSVGYDPDRAPPLILDKAITSFITRLAVTPFVMAEQNNAMQELAERGRLGIPITFSSDPRHHFLMVQGQSVSTVGYSRWPESLGFAALRDPALMRRFADIARREYRATGIQQALSPQADLFTDPRWARGYGGFGADAALSRAMTEAYVAGFQGGTDGLRSDGVLATVKHWVAYGASINGLDGHNYYGRLAKVDARSFRQHIEPFTGAFAAHVGAVMPTYDIVEGATVGGKPVEPVGAGFNRQILTDLLRGTYRFKGIILSDWAITNDCTPACLAPTAAAPQKATDLAMPWGVEKLTRIERFAKGMNAGIDQFGGVAEPELIVRAVERGLIPVARLDDAVTRIMTAKFQLGLFDDPFVDPAVARRVVNPPAVLAESTRLQAEAQVLLKDASRLLPLKPGTRVYLRGVDPAAVRRAGLVPVDAVEQAQVALSRAATPFETLHPYHRIGANQHEGRLDFRPGNPDLDAVQRLSAKVPVVVAIFLDRPAVLGPMQDAASVILGNFGVSDDGLLAAVTGSVPPRGRLPFEMPSSMAAVEAQNPAVPDDSVHPLYRFGAGIMPGRRPRR